jgi:hypothetical protein
MLSSICSHYLDSINIVFQSIRSSNGSNPMISADSSDTTIYKRWMRTTIRSHIAEWYPQVKPVDDSYFPMVAGTELSSTRSTHRLARAGSQSLADPARILAGLPGQKLNLPPN